MRQRLCKTSKKHKVLISEDGCLLSGMLSGQDQSEAMQQLLNVRAFEQQAGPFAYEGCSTCRRYL